MPTTIGNETLHFRCAWHAVEGHFEQRSGFAVKCEVLGCQNRGLGYWYRGAQFVKLPDPKSQSEPYG